MHVGLLENSVYSPFIFDRNIDITMLIRIEPGETKDTNSESKPLRRRIKRRNEILRPMNGIPGAVSSAVPDLGARSYTAEYPRVVPSKERITREGFIQVGAKRTG